MFATVRIFVDLSNQEREDDRAEARCNFVRTSTWFNTLSLSIVLRFIASCLFVLRQVYRRFQSRFS